jgi:hypothetical protein
VSSYDLSDAIVQFAEENELYSVKLLAENLKTNVAEFDFDKIAGGFRKLTELFK